MNTLRHAASSRLGTRRETLADRSPDPPQWLHGGAASVSVAELLTGTCLGGRADALAGRSVVIDTRDQYIAALALVELDGVARRLIVCPPDFPAAHRGAVVEAAKADAVVSDREEAGIEWRLPVCVRCRGSVTTATAPPVQGFDTDWVLFTSGTTGAPKMVVHSFATLTAPLSKASEPSTPVWGTFYDIRRYGGLQILFRAVLTHASLVLSGAGESIGAYIGRLCRHQATHVSGTPSHWRRALMSAESRWIAPCYIRLSGEIADQGILNALRAFYPHARVSHAFASTEAGVGFEVADGLEGFPAGIVGATNGVQVDVEAGSLRIRSACNAIGLLGDTSSHLTDADGFIETGDVVERRDDRYYFLGRRSGVINVGGLKVYPEEVESAINRHPAVRMSMVRPAKSSIVGSLVAADVVLDETFDANADAAAFRREILRICAKALAPHKVPATIRFVPALDIAAAGKLARHA